MLFSTRPKELIYNVLKVAGSSLGYKFADPSVCLRFGSQNGISAPVIVTDLNGFTLGKFETIKAAAAFMGVKPNSAHCAITIKSTVQNRYLIFKA